MIQMIQWNGGISNFGINSIPTGLRLKFGSEIEVNNVDGQTIKPRHRVSQELVLAHMLREIQHGSRRLIKRQKVICSTTARKRRRMWESRVWPNRQR